MTPSVTKSAQVRNIVELLQSLQQNFLESLVTVTQDGHFETFDWLRDDGRHGGGMRYVATDSPSFNQASLNFSHVHYDDLPAKSLASATALSCIIHPQHPHQPSLHMHLSWTAMKSGEAYWRIMADLNPSIIHEEAKVLFEERLQAVLGSDYESACQQGERYFYIPALKRQRGLVQTYLEHYHSANHQADLVLAKRFASTVITCYAQILEQAQRRYAISAADKAQQLAYHTCYAFQVLTLDRGTTSGLLVHDQNDLGIMGSLPNRIDKALLASWQEAMTAPQDKLLDAILSVLPDVQPCELSSSVRRQLAHVLREHYQRYPEALALQAGAVEVPAKITS